VPRRLTGLPAAAFTLRSVAVPAFAVARDLRCFDLTGLCALFAVPIATSFLATQNGEISAGKP
jgi:hypothetical protein